MLKLTTDKHEALRGLSATAEIVLLVLLFRLQIYHSLLRRIGPKRKKNIRQKPKKNIRQNQTRKKTLVWH